jgi:hypothetical protein
MKKIFSIFLSLMIFSCIKEVEQNPNVIVMKNDPRCELVADPGICQAAFQRYYFDKIEKSVNHLSGVVVEFIHL